LLDYLATLVPKDSVVGDVRAQMARPPSTSPPALEKSSPPDASAEQIGSAKRHPGVEYRVAPAEKASGLAVHSGHA